MRSTRVLTKYETTVIMPNSSFANGLVNNISAFGKRRLYKNKMVLSADNEPGKVEKAVDIIRAVVDAHELTDDPDVHFYRFTPFGFQIRVQFWVVDFKKYYDVCHEVNIEILNKLDTQGVRLAYPLESLPGHMNGS